MKAFARCVYHYGNYVINNTELYSYYALGSILCDNAVRTEASCLAQGLNYSLLHEALAGADTEQLTLPGVAVNDKSIALRYEIVPRERTCAVKQLGEFFGREGPHFEKNTLSSSGPHVDAGDIHLP